MKTLRPALTLALLTPLGLLAPAATSTAYADEAGEGSWLDNFSANLAVDGFYMADWNAPANPQAAMNVPHRAFDFTQGFALAFGIVDVAYETENFGATINLRFGKGADLLIGQSDPYFSILKQAYATWKPTDSITLDLGQFDTIYGAEVADSWQNLNYTRGALYFLMQPFYHTGLRVGVQASDTVGLTFLVVNGTNPNNLDNNQSPHLGAQISLSPSDELFLALGYYVGAGSSGFGGGDPLSDDNFEHFIDLVINATLGPITLVGNVDFYALPDADATYGGASLAAGLALTDEFGLALRGEYLIDPDLFISGAYKGLGTLTFTVDYRPIKNVIIRLDNKLEIASRDIYAAGTSDVQNTWFASTLGLVVATNP